MIVLAHRGWWLEPSEKNSREAFERAFDAGFGVETDLRDLNGALVISHDPARDGAMTFDDFLSLYVERGAPGRLALNIKADGLQAATAEALARHGVSKKAFVFDMSVPDALGYLRGDLETFTRHSEFETAPSFYDRAHGVWVDAFLSDWIGPEDVSRHLASGKQVALVSPELHGRLFETVWRAWADVPSDVMICTDHPGRARDFWSSAA